MCLVLYLYLLIIWVRYPVGTFLDYLRQTKIIPICLRYLFLFSPDGKRSTSSSGSDSSFKNQILESGILAPVYSSATVFSDDHLAVELYSLFLLFMEYLPVVRWPVRLWSPGVCWTGLRTIGYIGLWLLEIGGLHLCIFEMCLLVARILEVDYVVS